MPNRTLDFDPTLDPIGKAIDHDTPLTDDHEDHDDLLFDPLHPTATPASSDPIMASLGVLTAAAPMSSQEKDLLFRIQELNEAIRRTSVEDVAVLEAAKNLVKDLHSSLHGRIRQIQRSSPVPILGSQNNHHHHKKSPRAIVPPNGDKTHDWMMSASPEVPIFKALSDMGSPFHRSVSSRTSEFSLDNLTEDHCPITPKSVEASSQAPHSDHIPYFTTVPSMIGDVVEAPHAGAEASEAARKKPSLFDRMVKTDSGAGSISPLPSPGTDGATALQATDFVAEGDAAQQLKSNLPCLIIPTSASPNPVAAAVVTHQQPTPEFAALFRPLIPFFQDQQSDQVHPRRASGLSSASTLSGISGGSSSVPSYHLTASQTNLLHDASNSVALPSFASLLHRSVPGSDTASTRSPVGSVRSAHGPMSPLTSPTSEMTPALVAAAGAPAPIIPKMTASAPRSIIPTNSPTSPASAHQLSFTQYHASHRSSATQSNASSNRTSPAVTPTNSHQQQQHMSGARSNPRILTEAIFQVMKSSAPEVREVHGLGWLAMKVIWNLSASNLDNGVVDILLNRKTTRQAEEILLAIAAVDLRNVRNLSAFASALIKEHETMSQVCMRFLAGMCHNDQPDHQAHCPFVHPENTMGWEVLKQRWNVTYRDIDYAAISYLCKQPAEARDTILMAFSEMNLKNVKNLSAYLSRAIRMHEACQLNTGNAVLQCC